MGEQRKPSAEPPTKQPDGGAETGRERGRATDERTGRAAAYQRMQNQTQYVDLQIRQAAERGEFDDLPGSGKPIKSLGQEHDPDWWVKQLIEREQISGVLPPSLQLRKDDLQLDDQLDTQSTEKEVRRIVEEFNGRIHHAIYTNLGGPPVITAKRDVDTEVERWRQRRAERIERQRAAQAAADEQTPTRPRRRWFRRR